MKHRPGNRYLALAAAQTSPVPAPGREWTDEEKLAARISQARECETSWAAQREALIERYPGKDPWRLAQSHPQLRELDEALEAVRAWIADQGSG